MSLRDQFKKANLLSDKEAKRLAHEARVERSEKGRESLEQDAAQRHKELEQLAARDRERVRQQTERAEVERKRAEERAAVHALLADAKKPAGGMVKFYFEAIDGSLPWLELSPREAQELRAGAVCVVRTGPPATHTYRLLPLESTKRVARMMPEVIVFAPRGVMPN